MLVLSSIHSTLANPGIAMFRDSDTRERVFARRGDIINGVEIEEIYSPLSAYNGYLVAKTPQGHEITITIGDDIDNI